MKPYAAFAKVYDSFISKGFPSLHNKYLEVIQGFLEEKGLRVVRVLDTACGTGILLSLLRDNGFDATGIDLSRDMLGVAKEKGLRVYRADMASFEMGETYDLIINFDSLNHILKERDLARFFLCVRRHLSEDGLLIFDIDTKEKIEDKAPYWPSKRYSIGNKDIEWVNSKKQDNWVLNLNFRTNVKDGNYRATSEKHIMKGFSLQQIKPSIKKAGLRILSTYRDRVKKDSLLFICTRAKDKSSS